MTNIFGHSSNTNEPSIPPPLNLKKLNTRGSRAFTLVEMLIVIVIIGILAATLVPRLTGIRERARDINMEKTVKDLQQALMLYHIDHGQYPGEDVDPGECYWNIPHETNLECRRYANTCPYAVSGPTAVQNERWKRLMNDLEPYLQEPLIINNNEWPYCIYYMTPDRDERCPKRNTGYLLTFTTKATTFDHYDLYIHQGEFNTKARYCVYPLE